MTVHDILVEAYQNGHVYHGFIDALIGAGASIIGGLFGSKKKKSTSESTSTSTVNFKRLAKDAMAGGFNPLTALRAGAIGGYVTTKTKGTNVESGGGASIGAGIAEAGAQIAPLFGNLGSRVDPIKVRDKSTGAVSSLVARQIPGSSARAGSVVVQPRTTVVRSPRSTVTDLKGNKPGEGKLVGGDDPTVSSVGWNNGRYGIFHAPWMPDAEVVETVYGDNEINSFLYSVSKYANDAGYSVYRNWQSGKEDLRAHLKDKIRENNYREMAKRPFVVRPPAPRGYRYAQ